MKTTILKTENIKETRFTMDANVLTLDSVPSINEQDLFFNNDDSIVLEF